MRYKTVFSLLFSMFFGTANANWVKINNVDYTWGPFNIYNITLFTESGKYEAGTRPLMLSLQYKKPWEGRDFAVSLARTWKNLGIELPEQEADEMITNLRKNFPDIKPEDTLHYIALADRGYFILNDKVVSQVNSKLFNDAIVAIWLDPKMDISRQLLDPSYKPEPKPEQPQQATVTQPTAPQPTEASADKAPRPTEQAAGETSSLKTGLNSEGTSLPPTAATSTEEKAAATVEEKVIEEKPTETKATATEKDSKAPKIENPEIFISPIGDDVLMIVKNYS